MAESTERKNWWKAAIVAVIAIEVLGGLSGWLSNSGYGNAWFDNLLKPPVMPAGWVFALVWPILYAMLGVALAIVWVQPHSDRRRTALILFFIQIVLNFAWSPVFFALHDIVLAKFIIFAMAAFAAAAAGQFFRIRAAAGLLLVPYIAWLVFAATLTATIERLNPPAGALLLAL